MLKHTHKMSFPMNESIQTFSSDVLIQEHTSNLKKWIVCFTAALFFFYEFIQMNMFNVLAGDLLLARNIILIALGICVLGTTFLSFTHSFALAHLFRFMTGIGSAFCFLSSVRLASRWFHPKRLALVVGLIVTMAMTGGMIAQAPLSLLNHYLGWRQTVFCVAALGAIILILIYFLVQDYPPHAKHEHKAQCDELREMGYWHSMLRSYLNWQNWMGGIYTSLLNLPIVILGSLWGSLYLQQVYHFSPEKAASITSLLFLGSILGCPAAGWFSDYIGYRRRPMILGAIFSFVVILAFLYLPHFTAFSF